MVRRLVADRSVVAAGAVVTGPLAGPGWLYGGVPARPIKETPPGSAYFHRRSGFVA